MADGVKELTVEQLIHALKLARELGLDAAFIEMLENELKQRGILH